MSIISIITEINFVPNVINAEAKKEAESDLVNSQTIMKQNGMMRVPKITQNSLIPKYLWSPYLSPGLLKAKVPL